MHEPHSSKRGTKRSLAALLAVLLTGAFLVGSAPVVSAAPAPPILTALRQATNKFHNIATAERYGYGLLPDAQGITCIDMPGMGGMGVHWARVSLVGDGKLDTLHPEALVYAPGPDRTLALAAVEYVVFRADWFKTHQHRPARFGHTFNLTPAGNRFGLPAYFSLHVWVWKQNPAGMYSMWNPTVHCP